MQTQIACPTCRTQFVGDVYQIVDVSQQPELKEMLLSGYLNLVQCPSCGTVTQVGTPVLYHDPTHELFMVHVPMEMGLNHDDEQRLIGELVRHSMDSLPAEQRRAYMLQPQTVISMQSMIEQILNADGITPEMINQQKATAEFLQSLLVVDRQEAIKMIKGRPDDIDETFFALLRALMESAEQSGNEEQLLKIINLQAILYKESEYGRRLEKQQQAIHSFSRDVKNDGGLSSKLLLKHVLANKDDIGTVTALIMAGQQVFDYEFFVLLSDKIDKRVKSGINADELITLREQLLQIQQEMEQQSRAIMEQAQQTLVEMLQAEDKQAAVQANADKIDDMFLMVLSASQSQAEQRGDASQVQALKEVRDAIIDEMERQAPPEVRLVNQMLRAESDSEMQQILDNNQELVNPQLLELIKSIGDQAAETGDERGLGLKLEQVQSMVTARLLT